MKELKDEEIRKTIQALGDSICLEEADSERLFQKIRLRTGERRTFMRISKGKKLALALAAALAGYGQGISGERILSEYSVRLMRHNRLNEAQLKDFSRKHLIGCGYGLGVRTHLAPERSGLLCGLNEFGWGGAAGSCVIVDADAGLGVFYAQHTLNSGEEYYQPRLRNVVYSCL